MIKLIKNLNTEIIWRISRKIFLSIRNDSPSMQLDISEKNVLKHFLLTYKKEKKTIFDIGANIGSWSNLAFKHDKSLSIFAFEPIKKTYNNLKNNLIEHGEKVIIINKAISNKVGEFNIYNYGENEGTNSFFLNDLSYKNITKKSPVIEKISTTTIDIFCKENNIKVVDYIKCDTEGNDFNVILGCKEKFKNNDIGILQFEYNWRWIGAKSYLKDVFDEFENTDYLIGKLTPRKVKFVEKWNPEIEKFYEANYLIVHKSHLKYLKHDFYFFNRKNVLELV